MFYFGAVLEVNGVFVVLADSGPRTEISELPSIPGLVILALLAVEAAAQAR